MCNQCEEKTKTIVPELKIGVNLLRGEKVLKLPVLYNRCFLEDGSIVELIILENNNYSIECWEMPIRFGKYYGNRIFLNTMTDQFGINPKFVYDGKNKVWTLMNCGYVCFAEQELEYKSNHKLYGDRNA